MTERSVTGFPRVKASKHSLALRTPIFGVGVNDAWYMISQAAGGKRALCPFYSTWWQMMRRCYCLGFLEKNPAYVDCTVAPEWHSFMDFLAWAEKQGWRGLELDKDILVPGNKIYGPEFCAFVSHATNAVLLECTAAQGGWPVGVSYNKRGGKFTARCMVGGKRKFLGVYRTAEQAHNAWRKCKAAVVTEAAYKQTDNRVAVALLLRAASLSRC